MSSQGKPDNDMLRQLVDRLYYSSELTTRREVITIDSTRSTHRFTNDPDMRPLLAACLRQILADMRARYRYLLDEIDRLQEAGIAVGSLYKQLESKKEVKGTNEPTQPGQRA